MTELPFQEPRTGHEADMNTPLKKLAAALAACLLTLGGAAATAAPFDELLARVPAEANLIMAADLPALLASPLGREKKWGDKLESDFRTGLTNTPPTARHLLVAESFDYATLHGQWRLGLFHLKKECTPDRIAQRFGGTEDKVGGLPVVVCPRGQMFVGYSPTLVGEVNGVQRQELARWLRPASRGKGPAVSDYLRAAADSVGGGTQVVMAFDMADVFHASDLKGRLQNCKAIADQKADPGKVADDLATIQGAQVRFHVGRDIQGEIRLDFPRQPYFSRTLGKAMLLEGLHNAGADLDDFDTWTPDYQGTSFVLKGPLTPTSARLILSLVDNRATQQAYQEAEKPSGLTTDPKVLSSVQYFRSVQSLLEDIEPGKKANSNEKRTLYYRQYADKIDALPVLNVDPELLQYGSAVSVTLRNLARLSSMTKQQFEDAKASFSQGFADGATYGYGYGGAYGYSNGYGGSGGYGTYGGYAYTVPYTSAVNVDNYHQIRSIMSAANTNERFSRDQTWANIKQVTVAMRRKMAEKYKIEF